MSPSSYCPKTVETTLDTFSRNVDTRGEEVGVGVSGEIKTSCFRKLLAVINAEEEMEHLLSETHGFLSLGTATGVDVSLASLYNSNRISVGIEIQGLNVYKGKKKLPNILPISVLERVKLFKMDLMDLTTFDPFDIIYCNSKG
jgi:hypothetical protein